jgi:hypothetical protein
MLDVGEDELLVLLLVVEAQLDAGESFGTAVRLVEEPVHALVDRVAEGADLVQGGARQGAAAGARLPRPHRLVVGVEEVRVTLVHHAVAGHVPRQHEGLEEPRRVGQVPLRRARVRHGLDELVFRGEGSGQAGGGGAHVGVTLAEPVRARRRDIGRMGRHLRSLRDRQDGGQCRSTSIVSL